MATLGRACPSGRLRADDLYRHADQNVASYVADDIFFGRLRNVVIPRKKADTTRVPTVPLVKPRRTKALSRIQPGTRLRADNLIPHTQSDQAQYVGNDLFFGTMDGNYLDVLTVDQNATILVDPSTFVLIIGVIILNPPIGTVLVDVASFTFVTFPLTVLGPKPFTTGGGTTANVGYAG